LASRWISIVLALEVQTARRETDPLEIRRLIREMSLKPIPLWRAPYIHGELLKLRIDVGQTSVAKYMVRRRGGPSRGWRTFLCNHADGIVSIDLFIVPTLSFRLLYGFLVLRHHRRRIVSLGVTANPTAAVRRNRFRTGRRAAAKSIKRMRGVVSASDAVDSSSTGTYGPTGSMRQEW
jgi:hypothetical protein